MVLSKKKAIIREIDDSEISRLLYQDFQDWDLIKQIIEHPAFNKGEIEPLVAYVKHLGHMLGLEQFEDAYQGRFYSKEEFAGYMCNSGMIENFPASAYGYIDTEKVADTLFIEGYTFLLDSLGFGHVFKNA